MKYVGTWVFHSMGVMNDDLERVYLNAEEYLNSPMPYVDETDEDAVAYEMKERKKMVGIQARSVRTASSIFCHRCPRAFLRRA